MIAGRHSEDFYPITWLGRFPVYATTLLVLAHVLTMIGTAMAMSLSAIPTESPWLTPLFYSSADVLRHFTFWQFVTYAFVHPPSLWFAVEMWLLYVFGREVEKFIGRRSFLWLYAALLLVAPVALTLLAFAGVPSMLGGSGELHFAIFIAFVVIYPDAQILFTLQAKWVAAVLLGIYSLQDFSQRAWVPLGVLWLESACAVAMMHFSGVTNASFGSWLPEREEKPSRADRKKARAEAKEREEEVDLHESIDPLLEKISRHGIGSLTKRERARLDQARDRLLEREKQSR